MTPQFNITAFDAYADKRIHLFTWSRSNAEQGIERAKADAEKFGKTGYLSDYRAEPIAQKGGAQ